MNTQAYLGDGVYASFDGYQIELTANGVGPDATDRIFLDSRVFTQLQQWVEKGYADHNSGKKFGEPN